MQDTGNDNKNVPVNNDRIRRKYPHLLLLLPLLLRNHSRLAPILRNKKPVKTEDVKPTIPRVDLTGKLDSQGKLMQQERQCRIDKNLCLFCGGSGHRTDNCPVKAVRGRAAISESSSAPVSTPAKP